jgi:hypothetical protein
MVAVKKGQVMVQITGARCWIALRRTRRRAAGNGRSDLIGFSAEQRKESGGHRGARRASSIDDQNG